MYTDYNYTDYNDGAAGEPYTRINYVRDPTNPMLVHLLPDDANVPCPNFYADKSYWVADEDSDQLVDPREQNDYTIPDDPGGCDDVAPQCDTEVQDDICNEPNGVVYEDCSADDSVPEGGSDLAASPTWNPPIPYARSPKAPFPLGALPADVAAYVAEVAESTQTPVDMAGTAALVLMSVCMQGKYVVQGKSDWAEPLNVYACVIAPPSDRKSSVLRAMTKPLDKYEQQYNAQHAASFELCKSRRKILELKRKKLEEQAANGRGDPAELEAVVREIAELQAELPLVLYYDDITPEKLASVLAHNNGRAAIVSSEGGIFDIFSGTYSKKANANIDVILKAFSGDTIRVDRMTRDSEASANPSLTVLLMIQPHTIEKIQKNDIFLGRGLLTRFLYSAPQSLVGTRQFQSCPVDEATYQRYECVMFELLAEACPKTPLVITLSDEAKMQLTEFADEIEPKLVTDYAAIEGWAGKIVGTTLRIAGILCRASSRSGGDGNLQVDGMTMAHAISLGRYYLSHAMVVFGAAEEDVVRKRAEQILSWVRADHLSKIDKREAMRNCRSFQRAEEVDPVFDSLEEHGYIRKIIGEQGTTRGRPANPKYAVNPAIHTGV